MAVKEHSQWREQPNTNPEGQPTRWEERIKSGVGTMSSNAYKIEPKGERMLMGVVASDEMLVASEGLKNN